MLFYKLLTMFAMALTSRIESKFVNIGEASKIYLRPGLISVLELPHPVIEVRVGNPNELKVIISQVSPREMTLYFKNSKSSVTNLIVKSDRKNYVFDVIPNVKIHQDFVKITGGVGSLNSNSALFIEDLRSITPEKNGDQKSNLFREHNERISP